jgi:lipopolysaccharide export system protein LptA
MSARSRLRRGRVGRLGLAGLLALAPAGLGAQGLQHDASLPIEITADSLEVLQEQKTATFTGNVDAVQGDMVLSADQLRVHYGGDGGAAPAPGGAASIRRIEADGNVFLSSPRETAQGEAGVYDVQSSQVTIEGSVVLTQGDNVIRGERLEIDLVSGRSRMVAAVPNSAGGSVPQRVRALFVPEDKAKPAAGPAGDAQAAPDGAAAEGTR